MIIEKVKQTILENKLIKPGQIVGIGVSGGSDSMALLNILKSLSDELEFEVVAIHIDHLIREESGDDASFVMDYCKKEHIRAYKFKIDVPKLAKESNESLETAGRIARKNVFNSLIQKEIIDCVATAHHLKDQAETILLHLFRGCGLAGAKGMDYKNDNYIKPMLDISKEEINKYLIDNEIPYVIDSTNDDSSYSRNYIRNEVLPVIQKKWPNVVENLMSFSKTCREDDNYINSHVYTDACIYNEKTVKIPTNYFIYSNPVISRIIFKSLQNIGISQNIEKVHIEKIKELALSGQNGNKINLPNQLTAHKEYDYITVVNNYKEPVIFNAPFKCGEFDITEDFSLVVKRVKSMDNKNAIYLDYRKVPKNASWRFRENGDMFTKFGGGTKKLKSFLTDKKIPQRIKSILPVLALENEVFAIAGVEISDKVKVENVDTFYSIELISKKK